ncbi:MAG TPA: hypothetical protein VKI65_19000 [Gemmataceae bacterium]|nr:hypothetical protein [Gemmataceae bacterium]
MIVWRRVAGWAVFGMVACLATGVGTELIQQLSAGPRSVPARTAQVVAPSREPPLADRPAEGLPAIAVPPPATPTCEPTDPPAPMVMIRVRVLANASAGQELEYRIRVENTVRAAAHHVVVRNPLPANARFVRATPEPSTREPELVWRLGTLEGCACRDITLVLAPTGAGDILNCARVQFEHGECVTTRIAPADAPQGQPRLELTKRGPEQRSVNVDATYQITVTNAGTAALNNVIITDTIPLQTAFVSASDNGQFTGSQVQWPIGPLAAGGRRTVQLILRAHAAGEVINQATAAADGGLTARAEARTRFEGAAGLTVDIDESDDPVELGKEMSYTITVRNQGTQPVTDVIVVATAPEQMDIVRTQGPSKPRKEFQKAIYEPMTIQPGEAARFQVHVRTLKPGDVRFRVDVTAKELPAGPVHREESTTIYSETGARLQRPTPAPASPANRAN